MILKNRPEHEIPLKEEWIDNKVLFALRHLEPNRARVEARIVTFRQIVGDKPISELTLYNAIHTFAAKEFREWDHVEAFCDSDSAIERGCFLVENRQDGTEEGKTYMAMDYLLGAFSKQLPDGDKIDYCLDY